MFSLIQKRRKQKDEALSRLTAQKESLNLKQ